MPSGVYPRQQRAVTPSMEKQAFTVRLEADTYLKLHAQARQNKRTIRAEVEVLIEDGLVRRVPDGELGL